MTVETVTYISDFNTANPSAGDLKSEGDDHIRNIKIGVKGSFPNLVGAASPGSMGTSLGLVGTPAYSFTGDADTGMWSPAANTLAWSTAGAEAMRIDSSQNVGIGTTPTERLDLSTGAAATLIRFRNGSASSGYIGYDATSLKFYTTALERLVLTSDGRFYGTALHNNAGAVTGTTNQYVASGTYTPTITGVTNYTSSTARAAQWMRVGNVVTVSAQIDVTTTTSSLQSTIGVSLPIASSLANSWELVGTMIQATISGGAFPVGTVNADAANDRANVDWTTNSSGVARTMTLTFTYVVL